MRESAFVSGNVIAWYAIIDARTERMRRQTMVARRPTAQRLPDIRALREMRIVHPRSLQTYPTPSPVPAAQHSSKITLAPRSWSPS